MVEGRIRIRHTGYRGAAARRRGQGTRFDCFSVFITRFIQVDMHIDQTGEYDPVGCVDDNGFFIWMCWALIQDMAILNPEVAYFITMG